MNEFGKTQKELGLLRNFGWKRNLLALLAGFLICLALEILPLFVSRVRLVSEFDPSIAFMPVVGFLLGGWGVLGCLLESLASSVYALLSMGMQEAIFDPRVYLPAAVSLIVYCALPCLLWYTIPVPGEKRPGYPRMDTTAHVIKYYLIMVATVALYVLISAVQFRDYYADVSWRGWLLTFFQYLDIMLIFGLPLVILISAIRHRTFTINERMVLGFIALGVLASLLGAYLVYRNTLYMKPDLFEEYERAAKIATETWTDREQAAYEGYQAFWNRFYVMIAAMLNGLLLLEVLFMRSMEKKVTRPILSLAGALETYTAEADNALRPEIVTDPCKPYRYGYGEVSSLTRASINLVKEIDTYTRNLEQATSEREKIGTELDVASRIQRDMLPGIFPPFPDRTEIDLYASMTPAKEVGGDFYDFYFVDQDRLALTIADVSGKGIPASLFMVISKTLIQNHAQAGGSPGEILTFVNHQLAQNNTAFMFCTVWLGILDLKTGKLTAANAGHEYPVIRRKNGQFELIKYRHDPPLGLRDGLRFSDYELTLEPGDCFFEYTDGVTEATNKAEELFGEERLTESLNRDPDASPKALIDGLYDAIGGFVEDAPQFDDITMLGFRYLGAGQAAAEQRIQAELTVPARDDRLDEVNDFITGQLEAVDCGAKDLFFIQLAVEELFVNIAHYAYKGREGEAKINFSYEEATGVAEFVFSDRGIPFDPTMRPRPNIEAGNLDRPIGGLGIHIVKETMDDVHYEYFGGKNILTIRKKIK